MRAQCVDEGGGGVGLHEWRGGVIGYICWCLSLSPFGSFSILRLIPDLYADFPSFMPNYLANIFPVW